MQDQKQSLKQKQAEPNPQEHPCEMCGRFDAVQIGDRWLCVDCYEGCGSCCQEADMPESD